MTDWHDQSKNQFLLEITVLYAGLWIDCLSVKYKSKVKLSGLCVGYRLRTFHKSADTNMFKFSSGQKAEPIQGVQMATFVSYKHI